MLKLQSYLQLPKKIPPKAQELLSRLEWKIAVKAGVAASLSLYFGLGFSKVMEHPSNLISGTWCVLSTFVVMQAHLGGTYKAAWVRFLGVLIGSFMGGFFTYAIGSGIFSLGISVVCTVLACSLFDLKDSIRIACLSVAIVNILWGLRPDISPWEFALFRFLDSVLGILIAVIVAHTIWPAEATTKMRMHIIRTIDSINRYYRHVIQLHIEPEPQEKMTKKAIKEIWDLLKQDRAFLDESRLEMLTKTKSIESWNLVIDHLAKIYQAIQKLSGLQSISQTFDEKLLASLHYLTDQTESAFETLSKELESGELKKKEFKELNKSIDLLNQELMRYRSSSKTKPAKVRDIEIFFLFFYNLRFIAEEAIQLHELVIALNENEAL